MVGSIITVLIVLLCIAAVFGSVFTVVNYILFNEYTDVKLRYKDICRMKKAYGNRVEFDYGCIKIRNGGDCDLNSGFVGCKTIFDYILYEISVWNEKRAINKHFEERVLRSIEEKIKEQESSWGNCDELQENR